MTHAISDKCTACGKCEETCPVEAISKGDKIYKIDPDSCVDCGQCLEQCESGAIAEE